jgi:hypothetical protein
VINKNRTCRKIYNIGTVLLEKNLRAYFYLKIIDQKNHKKKILDDGVLL